MGFSGKLIDFDDSYFSGNPPTDRESLVGTPEYYSPEQAAYIMDEDEEISGSTLTLKSDIFTLGIILCEYFTGKKPVLPSDCGSTWICAENDKPISYAKSIPIGIKNLLDWMLRKNPNERPTINEVFDILKGIKPSEMTFEPDKPEPLAKPEKKMGLRSTFKKDPEPTVLEPKTTKSSLRSKTWDV